MDRITETSLIQYDYLPKILQDKFNALIMKFRDDKLADCCKSWE